MPEKHSKVCFVIMGFGKKTDFHSGNTFDLDKTYKNIIKPAVTDSGYECIRADEILESGIIDKSMYALLIQADLVIADITTYNPNAIYELGVRHGVKPFSTIVIREQGGSIPFDLNHTKIFHYTHLGEDIGCDEAERCKSYLKKLITTIEQDKSIDSPLYEFIKDITPPKLPESEYIKLVDELSKQETLIFAQVEKAKSAMKKSDFNDAYLYWEKAHKKADSEPYFIQQMALCKYKTNPKDIKLLHSALKIISRLETESSSFNDPETLGITGAIYKNLWWTTENEEFLDQAKSHYEKCFNITNDYYNGENYALCLDEKISKAQNEDDQIFYKISAKKAREKVIDCLNNIIKKEDDFKNRLDRKWIFASLSNCYLALNNIPESQEFEKSFLQENPDNWEIETFNNSRIKIKEKNNDQA